MSVGFTEAVRHVRPVSGTVAGVPMTTDAECLPVAALIHRPSMMKWSVIQVNIFFSALLLFALLWV